MKTYNTGDGMITIDSKNIVTSSNSKGINIGDKIPYGQPKACGWRKVKSPTIYFSYGNTSGNKFNN